MLFGPMQWVRLNAYVYSFVIFRTYQKEKETNMQQDYSILFQTIKVTKKQKILKMYIKGIIKKKIFSRKWVMLVGVLTIFYNAYGLFGGDSLGYWKEFGVGVTFGFDKNGRLNSFALKNDPQKYN